MTTPQDPRDTTTPADTSTNPLGDHPVGTGVGMAGGAAAGAAMGMVGGPIGAAVGAVVGAVVGGLAGDGIAAAINPTEEEAYWNGRFRDEPYYSDTYGYDDYAPAYRAGYESRRNGLTDWDSVRSEWARKWDAERGSSRLRWEEAEPAAQAAWRRANDIWEQAARDDKMRG